MNNKQVKEIVDEYIERHLQAFDYEDDTSGALAVTTAKWPTIHPKAKEKWLKVLRSGEYCQTTGNLVNERGYCCLGVLVDTVASSRWVFDDDESLGEDESCWGIEGKHGEIEKGGLPSGFVGIADWVQQMLAELNDEGASFKQIADVIEKYL